MASDAARADLIFLFPPVGWQRVNMGRALFEASESFACALRECTSMCDHLLPQPLLEVLYPDPSLEAICVDAMQVTAVAPFRPRSSHFSDLLIAMRGRRNQRMRCRRFLQ